MTLDFSKEYVLENDRVRLEPLKMSHFDVLNQWIDDQEIWTYFLGRSNGKHDFKVYLEDAISSRFAKKEYAFAVFDKKFSIYAGCTRWFDYDPYLAIIRLGYSWYGKKFWGTGLNRNCKYLLFEFAFEHLQVERVGLGAHAENTRSIAAMKAVGCQLEGKVRNTFPSINEGERADAILLGILNKEWFETTKQTLKQKL